MTDEQKVSGKQKLIIGLGEILWDLLPEGRQLGGAPANFAVMSARLGNRAIIASRLGDDQLGADARHLLNGFPADASHLQSDNQHPTSTVSVEFVGGQPHYVIHQPVAWDFMELTDGWRDMASHADAICFGSLAQRSETSRRTIHSFLEGSAPECVRVFDVNLRKPFYDSDWVRKSLQLATILKLNDVEVPEVLAMLGMRDDPRLHTTAEPDDTAVLEAARQLLAEFPLKLVCITMGPYGSLMAGRDEYDRHPGIPTKVADTVGAGDAFTAALVSAYLQGVPLKVMNEAGNRWGSWVASQRGAMPPLPDSVLKSISEAVQQAATSPR